MSEQKKTLFVPMRARSPEEGHRAATPLELFFDLVFVVAIAQAAAALHHSVAQAHVVDGLVSYLMVFFAIWWAWMNFTWFASAYDTDDVSYRLITFVQLIGALIVAAGVATAFDGDFRLVLVGYVIMRLALVTQWLRAAQADALRRPAARRYAGGIAVVQVAWVGFLFVPAAAQLPVFILLAIAELSVPLWAEQQISTPWHAEHIAERYGLLTIIVLGESILSTSLGVQTILSAGNVSTQIIVIITGGLLILFSMWWLYFERPAHHLLSSTSRAFIWGYGHYAIFASVAAVGAGLAVQLDYYFHHSELTTTGADAAVALPVAIYLLVLWALHERPVANTPAQRWLLPVMALLVLCTLLTNGQATLVSGLILAVGLATKLYLDART